MYRSPIPMSIPLIPYAAIKAPAAATTTPITPAIAVGIAPAEDVELAVADACEEDREAKTDADAEEREWESEDMALLADEARDPMAEDAEVVWLRVSASRTTEIRG